MGLLVGTRGKWEPVRRVVGNSLLFCTRFPLVATLPSVAAPPFDGENESSPSCAMEAELRSKVANLDVGRRASALVSTMELGARGA